MVTVIILTRNAAQLLPAAIASVKWADQLVIVDNGSTDDTLKIAKQADATIVTATDFPPNFSGLRNQGLAAAKGEWIFYLDVDERVTADLTAEIKTIITQNRPGVWQVARQNIILGQPVRYPAFWPDYVIRLFHKDQITSWQGAVHEQPQYKGQLQTLKGFLIHLTHRDIDSMVIKSLDWANIDAKLRFESNHPPMAAWRFIRIIFSELWYQGIVRKGFFNGNVGTIDAILQAFSLYLSYVKLWQLQQQPSIEEKYRQLDQQLIKKDFNY